MTDKQIKQNAEAYACPENSCLSDMEKEHVMTHFIAGAHSRDDEIKELQVELIKQKEYTKDYKEELELLKKKLHIKYRSIKH